MVTMLALKFQTTKAVDELLAICASEQALRSPSTRFPEEFKALCEEIPVGSML